MRLISWNCQEAFHRKAEQVLELQPDLLIVQECGRLQDRHLSKFSISPRQVFRCGDDRKGMAVFSFTDSLHLTEIPHTMENNRWVLPLAVRGAFNGNLFAVWAMNHRGGNRIINCIRPIFRTFLHYEPQLQGSTILLGDFNNNAQWDGNHPSHLGNFSELIKLFAEHDITSCYHRWFDEKFGEELRPTYFAKRRLTSPYHIDFGFCSEALFKRVKDVQVGDGEAWTHYSDHAPLLLDFDVRKNMVVP